MNEASNLSISSNTPVNEASIPMTMDTNPSMALYPPLNEMWNVNIERTLDISFNLYFDNIDDINSNHVEIEIVNDIENLIFDNSFDNIFFQIESNRLNNIPNKKS